MNEAHDRSVRVTLIIVIVAMGRNLGLIPSAENDFPRAGDQERASICDSKLKNLRGPSTVRGRD